LSEHKFTNMNDLTHIKRFNESEENSDDFVLRLTKEEAILLREALARTMAKGDALTVSMKIEDELYNYITKNQ
jgi:ribosomal protein S2